MTHSTGIPVSDELHAAFAGGRATARFFKVSIRNDVLALDGTEDAKGDARGDFSGIQPLLQPKLPCYILYRLDHANDNNQQGWIVIAYSPDGSSVKDRMTYAASRDNLKKMLGYSNFKDELFGSEQSDITWEAYEEHIKRSHDHSSMLTDSERLYAAEAQMEVAQGPSKEYVHSVKFPLAQNARAALASMAASTVNFVQLFVDAEKETIELSNSSTVDVSALASLISENEPRFSVWRWSGGEDSVVFIYSCPDSSKVKLKMLYSTVKAVAVGAIEEAGVKINKKLEVQAPSKELTEEALRTELQSNAAAAAQGEQKFDKPSRPGAKGGRRLIRTQK